MSPFYNKVSEEVKLGWVQFEVQVTEKYNKDYDLEDMKRWGVIDLNRYSAS